MALEMILKLNTPGMTSLHKAGLAGLYMTLKAFDKKDVQIKGLQWEVQEKQIVLNWTDDKPKDAFENLVKESFWIDDEGFIRLYGLEPKREMSLEQRHLLYEGLLNSLLQHGQHRKKKAKRNLGYEIDDKKVWIKDFEPIKEFVHQNVHKNWLDNNGFFKSEIEIVGWLYPGSSVKHTDSSTKNATTHRESFPFALCLLFSPVGVIYYLLKSKAKGKKYARKSRLALLIPEVKNLKSYAEIRQVIASQGVIDLTASSSSDAALRMLIALRTNSSGNQFAKRMQENFLCRVITLGIVDWSKQQKSRTATRTVISSKLKGFENYYLADSIFKNKWQQVQEDRDSKGNLKSPERFFVTTFCGREMIADNTANGKNWYHNISEFLANRETREQLYYERKELGQMTKEATYENENERIFIDVCHESWRRRMGKLGQRATNESTSFSNLANKEREKLRTSLARCKNAESLRETVIDYWSRAGSIKQLQSGGLAKILPLFDEDNWRKAKDLALLALISYQAPEETEDTDIETGGEK
ncbi:MAG: type I-MYXAN CRISPR-associated Cas8a1/Cmx1 [Aridibacter sp.]